MRSAGNIPALRRRCVANEIRNLAHATHSSRYFAASSVNPNFEADCCTWGERFQAAFKIILVAEQIALQAPRRDEKAKWLFPRTHSAFHLETTGLLRRRSHLILDWGVNPSNAWCNFKVGSCIELHATARSNRRTCWHNPLSAGATGCLVGDNTIGHASPRGRNYLPEGLNMLLPPPSGWMKPKHFAFWMIVPANRWSCVGPTLLSDVCGRSSLAGKPNTSGNACAGRSASAPAAETSGVESIAARRLSAFTNPFIPFWTVPQVADFDGAFFRDFSLETVMTSAA
eukprot:CAMPEP_0115534324 /NCGR_PEP_ID=MMETSP0271-20121206/86612_1 /TAXON_ID=71861 /ORGANISM="Scrippsiella trochoidea, Strain CCMP3099" /LENGTH=284 /DNA_ID=CAMNT_0002966801 /DNA_START=159 /DNA_END=1014 /DNA_ORIENTATION=-